MTGHDYLYGCDVLGAVPGTPIFTDSDTVRTVQQAIHDLSQYKTDKQLDLGTSGPNHDGVDGTWGPNTARAVTRLNTYYRAGGATDNDGAYITQGTLDALKLNPSAAPSGVVPGMSAFRGASASASGPSSGGAAGGAVVPASASFGAPTQTDDRWKLYAAGGLGILGIGTILYAVLFGRRG
jgi:hypothetical protein